MPEVVNGCLTQFCTCTTIEPAYILFGGVLAVVMFLLAMWGTVYFLTRKKGPS